MRNDPSRLPVLKHSSRVGRGATLAGYAIFAMALTIIVAVLLADRRTLAHATKGMVATQPNDFGMDEPIGVIMDEPALPPFASTAWPKPRNDAEVDARRRQ